MFDTTPAIPALGQPELLGRRDGYAFFFLAVTFLLGLLLVGVSGDFPLNDDWAYARGVESTVDRGTLELDQWPAMTLIAQTWVGVLYAKVFGFSFTVLRIATLVNSALHLALFYLLLRRFAGVYVSGFTALLLLLNPLYFSLSFSWMTEIHYLLGTTAATYCFVRYCSTPTAKWLLAAIVCCVFATLVRQLAVLLPLAFGLVLLPRPVSWYRRLVGLLPFLVTFLVLKGYSLWLAAEFPELYRVGGMDILIENALDKTWYWWARSLVTLLLYPGLFLLPLTIPLASGIGRHRLFRRPLRTALVLVPLLVFLVAYQFHFPTGNVLYNLGIGPRLLKGTYSYPEELFTTVPGSWWSLLNYCAIFGTALLALILLNGTRINPWSLFVAKHWNGKHAAWVGIGLYGIGYYLLTSSIFSLYDRYALPLVVVFAVLLVGNWRGSVAWADYVGKLFLVVFGVFAVGGTHDYLAWNRARLAAYEDLRDQGIPVTEIDAGFELNGWYQAGPDGGAGRPGRSWWFVTDDTYVIAFVPPPDHEPIATYPFRTLLPSPFREIRTYRRTPAFALDPDGRPLRSGLEKTSSSGDLIATSNEAVSLPGGELLDDGVARNGGRSLRLDGERSFGLTAKYKGFQDGDTLAVSVWRHPITARAGIVVSSNNDPSVYHTAFDTVRTQGEWALLRLELVVPARTVDDGLSVYLWQQSSAPVWLDDYDIRVRPVRDE